VHYLHMVHVKDAHGHWFVNTLFIQVPPNHQDISLYLMLYDERFLNALLSVRSPSINFISSILEMRPRVL
jgi:hypothetical protein